MQERRRTVEAAVVAAVDRLLRQGHRFTDLTTQQIANEAAVARSTLYLYFGEKNALLIGMATTLGQGAYEIVDRWHPGDPRGLAGLADTFVEVIRYYRERAHVLGAITEVSGYDRAVREHWTAQLDKFVDLAQAWLLAEQRAGHAAADLDRPTAGQIIVHGGNQAIASHVASGDPARDQAVAQEIAAAQWFGGLRRTESR
ncbi:TetR/AcrR family transcriptional regulator [Asanoa hainanensis]|uniref:TetR/AcrR family transcriptional regulator n=1 Tax=Asanoa hainanensis TaxID=560556 RepID=UPI0015C5FF31|nr:TetR/AcrR family transcriptional regulator [Asanoa hainanensis]